jgi:hypothetical protein
MDVQQALESRHSVRAFLPEPIPEATLRRVLAAAQRAPSWCNIQSWQVWLTSGDTTRALTGALTEAASSSLPSPDFEWPGAYPEPYRTLRRDCGAALYDAMGIARGDAEARRAAWMRNYVAFDAPHVAIVGMDRRMGLYPAIDVGCWLQSLVLALTSEGLAACPQASLATHPSVPRELLGIPDEIGVLFGIAIGKEDPSAAANRCRMDRDPYEAHVRFV